MSARLGLGAAVLGAAMGAAGVAGFVAQAQGHPRVETSAAAGCAGCHMTDYRGARHHAGEKPTTCGICHAQSGWHPTRLEHDAWPLTGAHAKAKCFACHTGNPPVFHATDKACVACHRPDYERAPGHVARRFATTCEECHTDAAWKPTRPHHAQNAPGAAPVVSPTEPAPVPRAPPTARPAPAATAQPKPRPAAPRPAVKPKTRPAATVTARPDTVTGASRR